MFDLVSDFAFFDQVDALDGLVVLSVQNCTLWLVALLQKVEQLLQFHVRQVLEQGEALQKTYL